MGSLQFRLFLTYLAIIVVTLGLAALSLFLLLGGYRDSISYGNLEDIGGLINQQAENEVRLALAQGETQPTGAQLLLLLRGFIERSETEGTGESSVAVVDRQGRILEAASSTRLQGATVEDLAIDALQVADGPREPRRCRVDVPGGRDLLCVSLPLSETALTGFPGSEAAAIIVAKPSAALGEVMGDLAPRLVFSGLIGVAAALLLGALMSRSISAPLRNIARAARSVARGNYRQRVPVTGPGEVRELAADFNQMTGQVQRSQQTLRDFLMNISHELKTPLTSISGFSQAMLDGTVDDPDGIQRSARIVNAESSRVLRLVEELLDLSRIESGQQRMRQDVVDIHELFQHLGEVFALRSEERSVRLEIRPEPGIRATGDFDRLEQVLGNLLDNAFRHTPEGGTVRMVGRRLPGPFVQVSVSDTGTGIPEEDLGHLFERFYRGANGANGAGGKGYGLGLAITREIVRAHGGDIRVTSDPGLGTTFTFTLPSADQTVVRVDSQIQPVRRKGFPGLPARPPR